LAAADWIYWISFFQKMFKPAPNRARGSRLAAHNRGDTYVQASELIFGRGLSGLRADIAMLTQDLKCGWRAGHTSIAHDMPRPSRCPAGNCKRSRSRTLSLPQAASLSRHSLRGSQLCSDRTGVAVFRRECCLVSQLAEAATSLQGNRFTHRYCILISPVASVAAHGMGGLGRASSWPRGTGLP